MLKNAHGHIKKLRLIFKRFMYEIEYQLQNINVIFLFFFHVIYLIWFLIK